MAGDDTPSAPQRSADDPPQEPEHEPEQDDATRILRRVPLNTGAQPVDTSDPQTSIIRRTPTGSIPVVDEQPTGLLPRAKPVSVGPVRARTPSPNAAIATTVASILSGWATGVIATDLITGWWGTDLLFCIAMAFLTAISAAASISGLVALLLRRRTARLLIVVGAGVALLIFAGLFIAGAKLPAAVYFMPVLPLVSIVLAALPATARWSRSG